MAYEVKFKNGQRHPNIDTPTIDSLSLEMKNPKDQSKEVFINNIGNSTGKCGHSHEKYTIYVSTSDIY